MNKQQKKLFDEVVISGDQETAEDFQTAMQLLNKYQKDKEFLKKDVTKIKKEAAFILQETDSAEETKKNSTKTAKGKPIDPSLTISERHKAV